MLLIAFHFFVRYAVRTTCLDGSVLDLTICGCFFIRRLPFCSVFLVCAAAIGTAFAVLSDGDKRAHYDRYGDDDGPQVSNPPPLS